MSWLTRVRELVENVEKLLAALSGKEEHERCALLYKQAQELLDDPPREERSSDYFAIDG